MAIELNRDPWGFTKSKIPYFVGVNTADIVGGIFQGYNPKAIPEIKVNEKSTYINPLLRSTYKEGGNNFRLFYTRRLPFFPFQNEYLTYSNYLDLNSGSKAITIKNFKDGIDGSQDRYPIFDSGINPTLDSLLSFYIKENKGTESYQCSDNEYFERNSSYVDYLNDTIIPINLNVYGLYGIKLKAYYLSSLKRWEVDLVFTERVNSLEEEYPLCKWFLPQGTTIENSLGDISRRKCALGYTRIDYGGTDLSGTWIFVQLDFPKCSATSFTGIFIPDNVSSDDDIRVVTENSSNIYCTITGMSTNWEKIKENLAIWRRSDNWGPNGGIKFTVQDIINRHTPVDVNSDNWYSNPMVIWYKN